MNKLPNGLWPVMLTPFNDNSKGIDFEALEELVEFYISNGAKGLFVNCLSSEMFHLTREERIKLTSGTVKFAKNRVPVISTGTFKEDNTINAAFSKEIFETGASAVVINSNQLTGERAGEDEFKSKLEEYLSKTEQIPLGIYECPVPYKRLLSPELLQWMVSSNRFLYFKDTSCDNAQIARKIKAIESSALGLYNANIPTALESLKGGACGLSPIGANLFPELYAFLCDNFQEKVLEKEIKKINTFLSIVDPLIHSCYPYSAKWFLKERGLKIKTFTRTDYELFTSQDIIKFHELAEAFQDIRKLIHNKVAV